MVAEEYRMGGTCVIRGCVPKKLFVIGSHFRHEIEDAAGFGWTVPPATFDWPTLIANKDKEIARLEAEVGTPLRRRHGRVLRMTHAGVAFKSHVDSLVHDLDDGLAAVQELVDPGTGVVTLAFPLSLGTWLVPRLIGEFTENCA